MAAELQARGVEVIFVGGQRAELELVPAAGFELRQIRVEGISRTNPLKAIRAVARSAAAVLAARSILAELRPAAVMGGGGYVAGPVGAAAAMMGIPVVLTGRPGPPIATDREAARARFDLLEGETCVLVFGGSLGARSINEAAVVAFGDAPFRVLHVTGSSGFASTLSPRLGYDVREYLEQFGEALLAADLVVARSGGSVFEIAAYGRPALLIPYPQAAGDHQAANAAWMADAGAAVVIADSELTAPLLARTVGELLDSPSRLAGMAKSSRQLARPQAAHDVAGEIIAAANKR
ncbi:MAG: glycosyltransferase [Solirubrobacterales bacterium]|nr:glycosyltransferase [Solirubrobacterales bacterium]